MLRNKKEKKFTEILEMFLKNNLFYFEYCICGLIYDKLKIFIKWKVKKLYLKIK